MIWVELVCDRCNMALEGDSLHMIATFRTTRASIIKAIHEDGESQGWTRVDGKDYCPECKELKGERDDLPYKGEGGEGDLPEGSL